MLLLQGSSPVEERLKDLYLFFLGLPYRFNMLREFDTRYSHCPVLETAAECTCSAVAAKENSVCLPDILTTACFLFLPNLELTISALV